mmetsp:Transcript_63459/g.138206  ORF Transcript_63459/g.138206 Transcript_63459/m.138206 type:complete len:108 (+) Transcript_63459:368-691(+)
MPHESPASSTLPGHNELQAATTAPIPVPVDAQQSRSNQRRRGTRVATVELLLLRCPGKVGRRLASGPALNFMSWPNAPSNLDAPMKSQETLNGSASSPVLLSAPAVL